MEFFFLGIFFVTFFGVIVLFSRSQVRKSKRILNKLKPNTYEHIKVRYSCSSSSKFSITIGWGVEAEMYFNKKFILICPKEKSYINCFYAINLPIFVTRDEDLVSLIPYGQGCITVKFKLSDWNSISIKSERNIVVKTQISIQINPKNKFDREKLAIFRDWNTK
jgi:hypothetical protein